MSEITASSGTSANSGGTSAGVWVPACVHACMCSKYRCWYKVRLPWCQVRLWWCKCKRKPRIVTWNCPPELSSRIAHHNVRIPYLSFTAITILNCPQLPLAVSNSAGVVSGPVLSYTGKPHSTCYALNCPIEKITVLVLIPQDVLKLTHQI